MKSTRMIQAVAVAAVTLMAAAVFVSVVAESSDAYTADPTISDSGFIKDKKAAFYYSKFATSGFLYSEKDGSRSISADTPTAGVGKVMQDNTVYASISKLNKDKQYYLAIEEYSSKGELNYGVIVTLKSSVVQTFVFMSVNDGKAYSEADALTVTPESKVAKTGFTTEVTNDIYYTFKLTTSENAKSDILCKSKVENPAQFSKIAHVEVKVNDITDEVSNIAKNYGYTSSGAAQYAGAEISYGAGTYICVFFVTNISKENLEITVDATSKFTVKADGISYGKNVTSGYGYAVISQDAYPGENFDKVTVSIGENGKTYASDSNFADSADDNKDKGTTFVVGIVIVFIAAILISLAYNGGHKKEE